MAAYVVQLSQQEWDVIKGVLARAGEGAILVTPEENEKLKAAGIEIEDGAIISYDFGGEPDIVIDRLTDCSLDALMSYADVPDPFVGDYTTRHDEIRTIVLGEN